MNAFIQQECMKFISDSKDIYNVNRDFYKKSITFINEWLFMYPRFHKNI